MSNRRRVAASDGARADAAVLAARALLRDARADDTRIRCPGSGPGATGRRRHRRTPSLVWLTTPSPQTPAIVVLELDVVGVDVVVGDTTGGERVVLGSRASALASAPRAWNRPATSTRTVGGSNRAQLRSEPIVMRTETNPAGAASVRPAIFPATLTPTLLAAARRLSRAEIPGWAPCAFLKRYVSVTPSVVRPARNPRSRGGRERDAGRLAAREDLDDGSGRGRNVRRSEEGEGERRVLSDWNVSCIRPPDRLTTTLAPRNRAIGRTRRGGHEGRDRSQSRRSESGGLPFRCSTRRPIYRSREIASACFAQHPLSRARRNPCPTPPRRCPYRAPHRRPRPPRLRRLARSRPDPSVVRAADSGDMVRVDVDARVGGAFSFVSAAWRGRRRPRRRIPGARSDRVGSRSRGACGPTRQARASSSR